MSAASKKGMTVEKILAYAAVGTAPAAWLGLRMFSMVIGTENPAVAAMGAPFEVWGDIAANPFWLPMEPVSLMGALVGACVPWALAMWALTMLQENKRTGEEHGSARWATPREIEPFWRLKNPDPVNNKLLLSKNSALALSRDGFSIDYDRNLNVLVIGGSGAGKTRYYVKPNILQMNSDYFVTDPKGDLINDVKPMLEANGYEVALFDTFMPQRSLVYNPLYYVRTDLEILSFAGLLIKMTNGTQKGSGDPFWEKSETLLYISLIALLRDWMPERDYHIGSILTLLGMAEVKEDNEDYESPLDLIFKEIETGEKLVRRKDAVKQGLIVGVEETTYSGVSDEFVKVPSTMRRRDGAKPSRRRDGKRGLSASEDFALENYKKFKTAAGKTLKSIIISCNVRLAPFTTSEVKKITCGADQMELGRFGEEGHPRALFAVFKDTDQSTLGFLHGMMVYQTINKLCEKALAEYGGKLPRCVNFILDEYRSLNLPQDISGFISVTRSRNIAMSVILQSIAQLEELYEPKTAEAIRGCCDTTLYLGGGKEETCKFISDTCGQQTVNDVNYSSSHGGQGSWSKSGNKIARPLIDPAEVGKLPKSECIVLINGADPFRDQKYPLEQHPRYSQLKDPVKKDPETEQAEAGDAGEDARDVPAKGLGARSRRMRGARKGKE